MNENNEVSDLDIKHIDPTLYNEDLAPLKPQDRNWGAFEVFNVWSNDIQYPGGLAVFNLRPKRLGGDGRNYPGGRDRDVFG